MLRDFIKYRVLYRDVIPHYPNKSQDAFTQEIENAMCEDQSLTEWPDPDEDSL